MIERERERESGRDGRWRNGERERRGERGERGARVSEQAHT
jgi:hypothetical protein